ncbi:hypothetical protein GGS21DRAFT_25445 [Xylaria nigripes]|nr:hypothetical protein GGS21DRAFT_25445 [Xylaria nigripes]
MDSILEYASETKESILNSLLEDAREQKGLGYYPYEVNMPLLLNSDEAPLPCRETPAVFEAINSSFSAQVHALFQGLQNFESLSKTKDGSELIDKDCLMLTIRTTNQSFDRFPSFCRHRNFHSQRLYLRDPAALPQLWRVSRLRVVPKLWESADIYFEHDRPVSMRVPLELMQTLPALRELECPWLWERMPLALCLRSVSHYAQVWAGPWRDARHEFGKAVRELELGGLIPASLTRMRLWFWKPSSWYDEEDQSARMPNLILPDDADPVSLGLRTLASHLEQFDLRAFLTPDFFRAPVVWPRMKRLQVEFHPWSPDGTWYFVGPRGEDPNPDGGFEITREQDYPPITYKKFDDEMDKLYTKEWECEEPDERLVDMFRTEPLARKIEPLLCAFAQALKGMPALEEAELFAYLAWQPSEERQCAYEDIDEAPFNCEDRAIYRWGVSYAPGKDGDKGLVTWQVGSWRPQGSIIQSFEALGREGCEIEMIWKPFEFKAERWRDYQDFL